MSGKQAIPAGTDRQDAAEDAGAERENVGAMTREQPGMEENGRDAAQDATHDRAGADDVDGGILFTP